MSRSITMMIDSRRLSDSPLDRNSPTGSPTATTANRWNNRLLLLQEQAPCPKKVLSRKPTVAPPQYGDVFHGLISREESDRLLAEVGEGAYLVRESTRAPNAYTLCLRWDGTTKNYKLYYDDHQHYVGEKKFGKLEDLVADGLIHMYVEKYAADYIRRMPEDTVYEESPYSEYQRRIAMEKKFAKRRFLQGQARHKRLKGGGLINEHRSRLSAAGAVDEGVIEEEISDRSGSSDASATGGGSLSSMPGFDNLGFLGNPVPSYSFDSNASSMDFHESGQLILSNKAHVWKVHTWRAGGSWCDFCRNWMWGLVQQGLKCEDCGFGAHQRCTERVLPDCRPDLKYVKRMFAVDLTTLTMAHQVALPPVVVACVEEIEARGIRQNGIYRIPGCHEEVETLRIKFDTIGSSDLSRVENINSVASLLKLYFRLLPVPLITYSCYKTIVDLVRSPTLDERIRVRSLAKMIRDCLPQSHQTTLQFLLIHLANVVQCAELNKMPVENLARIFAPTLMRNPDPIEAVAMAGHEQYLVAVMITSVNDLFLSR